MENIDWSRLNKINLTKLYIDGSSLLRLSSPITIDETCWLLDHRYDIYQHPDMMFVDDQDPDNYNENGELLDFNYIISIKNG